MAETTEEARTVAEFVETILDTEIPEAKKWFDDFRRGVPEFCWETFCKFNTTAQVVDQIAFGISTQISRQVRNLWRHNDYRPVLENGHKFLQEIHRKAIEIGLEVDVKDIDRILAPHD